MSNSLEQRESASVLIIEPASSVRFMLSEVLRDLGFTKIQSTTSAKEALQFLEVETVHWIVAPLLSSDEINTLMILRMITEVAGLRHIQCSLLIDPTNDSWSLTAAFELGLLSYHKKSYVKDAIIGEFEELFSLLAINNWSPPLTAAVYLRAHLSEKHHVASRKALDQNLLSLFPGSPRTLLPLAETELASGSYEKGVSLLKQAELIDPRVRAHCQKMLERFKRPEGYKSESSHGTLENILGIKSVVVVDPDTDILHSAKELLHAIGVVNVETFEDGKAAFEWISTSVEPDLILTEWRLPSISGPVLIQRIRQHGFLQVPIIVDSSLVRKEEKPLLREMGVDDVIEKPFDHTTFYGALIWAIQQNRMPTEQKSLERKIKRLLDNKKVPEAERLIAQMLADPRVDDGAKKSITAEYEFSKQHFSATVQIGMEALMLGGDSLSILNLLGKAMIKLGQYPGALKCFEKAHSLSPLNIEHLLKIAEVEVALNDLDSAQKALDSAAKIDEGNLGLHEANTTVALEAGNLPKASSLMAELDSGIKIVAYMNNRAISLIRSGRFEEGITLYKRAMETIPDKWREIRSTVQYNFGLAHARYGDYEQAIATLMPIVAADTTLGKKAYALKVKVERCIKTSLPLFQDGGLDAALSDEAIGQSKKPQDSPSVEATDFSALISKIDAKRGDIGCFLIYHCLEGHDERVAKALMNQPHFLARKGIDRPMNFTDLKK